MKASESSGEESSTPSTSGSTSANIPVINPAAVTPGTKQNPPKFIEGSNYDNWRKKVQMWSIVTGYTKSEQAVVVMLSCFDNNAKAERSLSELGVEDLHHESGLANLLSKLDGVYRKDKIDDAYESYKRFIQWERPTDMTMQDFIVEFEHRYQQMTAHDMKLPDSIQAFILVDASRLPASGRQMAFTIANDLKYDTMKSALKRIFPESDEQSSHKPKTIMMDAEACYSSRRPPHRKHMFNREEGNVKYNPMNKQGQISRCAICDSKMHWAHKCPHNVRRKTVHIAEYKENDSDWDNDDQSITNSEEFINAVFHTKDIENETYVAEATGCAILDTACTKTVCGERWINAYIDKLDDDVKRNLKVLEGGASFKFGDGRRVISIKRVKLPVNIAKVPCFIITDVVKENLPLLLSKSTLKKTRTTLNMENDEATMLGKPIKLQITTNGHYCVDIHPRKTENLERNEGEPVFFSSEDKGSILESKNIMKLHKQFGHASAENIIRLLKRSSETINQPERNIIHEVISNCKVCALYRRPPPRPAVGLPRSRDVNETVALDLHQLMPNLWFLHMIDEFSRFSSAVIIKSKQSSIIVRKFMQFWISIMGAPKKVVSDNGKEFDNVEFKDMCENFNISVMTTPSYSAWCNGICERHNRILSEILVKTKKDTGCDFETGLAWAVSAKNSLINHNGFSPNQIVFGRQTNLPSVINDQLPALEGKTMSERVGENIAALYASRRAFTAADSSERIRKALRCKTRPFSGNYKVGDSVYYKRNDSNEWKGPARVLGQDGVVVFLRYGAQLYRAHASRVQKINEENDDISEDVTTQRSIASSTSDDASNSKLQETQYEVNEPLHDSEAVNRLPILEQQSTEGRSDRSSKPKIRLKTSQIVRFQRNGTEYEAEITGRAGKATGKYPNAFNVKYRSPSDKPEEWIDFDHVENLTTVAQEPNETNLNEATDLIFEVENVDFSQAKDEELKHWIDNKVFEEQENQGQKCISVRWVCSLKKTKDGVKPKARLVARGFEDPDVANIEKYSPTCCKSALRTVISVTTQMGWKLHSMDIKTAFLQGEELARDVFLMPPKEARTPKGKVWKLKKCVYGLCDASLQWYDRVKRFMLENRGKMAKSDPSVFYWHDHANQLQGLIAVHVDDFLWAGTSSFKNDILPTLRETFKIGNEESGQFGYLGLEVKHEKSGVIIEQTKYVHSLKPLTIDQKSKVDDLLTTDQRNSLRARIGQFLWISTQTRPDISYDVCILATNFKNAVVRDLHRANKVLRRLKSDTVGLRFRDLGPSHNLKLVCYTDASFANLDDGGSQAGNLVFLAGENGVCNLLSWESKKLKRVVKSSLAAETLALSEGIDNAVYVGSLIAELCNGGVTESKIPIEVITDNFSLYNAVKSHKQVSDKRLRVDLAAVKEMVENKQITCIDWTESKYQLADKLTKAGASSTKLLNTLHDGQLEKF